MKVTIDWDDISLNKNHRQELVNHISSYLSQSNINEVIDNGDILERRVKHLM